MSSKQAGASSAVGQHRIPMQRPCTVYYVCTIEARWCGGGGHRERRGPPRRSWVERPYIGASVRWELPYTDRLARPPSVWSSTCGPIPGRQAGSPGPPRLVGQDVGSQAGSYASQARMLPRANCRRCQGSLLAAAGRRSQLAVSCDETACREQCSSRSRSLC